MSIKKKVTGSGFTKRRRTVISEPFGDEEIRAFRNSTAAGEDDLDMIERNSQAILQRAGLPDSQRAVVWSDDGSWREALDGIKTEPAPGEAVGSLCGRVGDGRQIPEDSPEGYASRMLARLNNLRAAIQRGGADRAGREGLHLGALWREMEMKMRMEPSALRGVKFIDGPTGQRVDDLGKAIDVVLNDLGDDTSPRAVWKALMDGADAGFPPFDVISPDDSDAERLYWKCRSTGKWKSLSFDSLKRRLRGQKKKRASEK